jgi:RNA polymerase sigma-70 factor, ECF subfamily
MLTLFHKNIEQLSKEQLQIEHAKGNPADFEPLYNENFEKIFRFIYQRADNKDEASDITSQVFLKALLHLKSFQYRSVPFSAWLYRIALNEISDYYSKSKKSRKVNIDSIQINTIIEEAGQDVTDERIEHILTVLKYLPENDLLLIEMRFFENRPFKEIADILKITENNAKVRVYRVIDKIKEKVL